MSNLGLTNNPLGNPMFESFFMPDMGMTSGVDLRQHGSFYNRLLANPWRAQRLAGDMGLAQRDERGRGGFYQSGDLNPYFAPNWMNPDDVKQFAQYYDKGNPYFVTDTLDVNPFFSAYHNQKAWTALDNKTPEEAASIRADQEALFKRLSDGQRIAGRNTFHDGVEADRIMRDLLNPRGKDPNDKVWQAQQVLRASPLLAGTDVSQGRLSYEQGMAINQASPIMSQYEEGKALFDRLTTEVADLEAEIAGFKPDPKYGEVYNLRLQQSLRDSLERRKQYLSKVGGDVEKLRGELSPYAQTLSGIQAVDGLSSAKAIQSIVGAAPASNPPPAVQGQPMPTSLATRQQVLDAYKANPQAILNPDEGAINYWMTNGLSNFDQTVQSVRQQDPALAARIDAERSAASGPSANLGVGGGVPGATPRRVGQSVRPQMMGAPAAAQPTATQPQPAQNLGMGAQPASNPYLSQMDESIKSEVNDNLNRNILPGIRSGAVAAGQYGGSRQGVVEANALNDASKATANAMAGVRYNGYQFDKNYGLANDTLNFNIDQANYNRGVTNLGLGFGVMDKMLDYQRQGYDIGTTQQNAPLNYWNQFMNQANATGGRGATNTTNMQGNPWMGAIGGAALGSSIYKNFGFGG